MQGRLGADWGAQALISSVNFNSIGSGEWTAAERFTHSRTQTSASLRLQTRRGGCTGKEASYSERSLDFGDVKVNDSVWSPL